MVATIIVCSNDIPRAGIMDASHKDCVSKALSVLSCKKDGRRIVMVTVISGVLFLCCIFNSGSIYSNSELRCTKGGRDFSLVPRLFLGKGKWASVRG